MPGPRRRALAEPELLAEEAMQRFEGRGRGIVARAVEKIEGLGLTGCFEERLRARLVRPAPIQQ